MNRRAFLGRLLASIPVIMSLPHLVEAMDLAEAGTNLVGMGPADGRCLLSEVHGPTTICNLGGECLRPPGEPGCLLKLLRSNGDCVLSMPIYPAGRSVWFADPLQPIIVPAGESASLIATSEDNDAWASGYIGTTDHIIFGREKFALMAS